MTLSVKTLPRAEADIRGITRYIYDRSRHGAAAWVNALDQARLQLVDNAMTCGQCDENEHFDIDVKQMLFKTRRGRVYRILFTVVDDEVRILRVRGSGQAPIQPNDLESR